MTNSKSHAALYLITLIACLTFAAGRGVACTCMGAEGKNMREVAISLSKAENAQVIFEGLVEQQELRNGPLGAPAGALSMTMAGSHRAVFLKLLKAYRGVTSAKLILLTGLWDGDCGFDFETGKKYLVYANRIDAANLFTSICTGTSSLEHADPKIRYLRGEQPSPDDLLPIEDYQRKAYTEWYGTACGHVTKSDGTPLDRASLTMSQLRVEPFPPKRAADPNGSKSDGSFCIRGISPGKYLLTAEWTNYDEDFRLMGYYPGVRKRSEAVPIEIHAGENLSDLKFSARRESLYTVAFRIVTPDGSNVPAASFGVAIDCSYSDGLAYHLTQNGNEDGIFYAGYVPPGYYTVQTYINLDDQTRKVPPELSKWGMAKQEVVIPADKEIIELKLKPVK